MKLYMTTRTCPLGRMLLAADRGGVRALLFGDDDSELLPHVSAWFPGHSFVNDSSFDARCWTDAVVSYFCDPRTRLDMPVVLDGSDFQKRVWGLLREIPLGATCSYAEVARRIGMPRAARAVARACSTNRIALLVPCHRVVRSDGGLSGYRWGASRKQWLLDWETQFIASKESTAIEAGHLLEPVEHIAGNRVAAAAPGPVALAHAR